MVDQTSSTLPGRFQSSLWPRLAVVWLAVQLGLLPLVRQGDTLRVYTKTLYAIYFFSLLLGTVLLSLNAVRSRQTIRLFWSFLAVACGLRMLCSSAWVYYTLILGKEHPDFWLSAGPLYLHTIFLIAAVASRPHLKLSHHQPYQTTLNLLLLLFFFLFAYALVLFPAMYTQFEYSAYVMRGQALYSAENLLLLLVLGVAVIDARPPWKAIYRQLLGASALYAFGSLASNLVIASGNLSAGWYTAVYMASAYWIVWIALLGRERASQLAQTVQSDALNPRHVSTLAMLAVVAIPAVGVWELFRNDRPYATHVTRLLIVFLGLLLLAITALITEYFTKRELFSDVGIAHDRLRMAMLAGKSVGWEWNLVTGQDLWFGDLQTMFGVASDTFSGQVGDFFRYLHPDDRKRVSEAVTDARVNHKPYEAEFRVVRQDGMVRWVAARGVFHYARNGEAERMLGMPVDITDRKQAEEGLKKSEEKFSRAFRQSPMAMTLTSIRDHRYLDINETFEQLTGWRRDEVIGRTPFDIQIWADPTKRTEFVRQLRAEGAVRNVEVLYRCKNGEQRVGLGSGEMIEIDGEPCVLSVIADITERRDIEEKLRDSEQRMSNIFGSAMDSIIATDEVHRIMLFNPAAEKMFGCPASEAIGSAMDRFIPERFREEHKAQIGRFAESGMTNRAMGTLGPAWGVRTNGEEFPIEASISQVESSHKKMFTVIIRDITERRRGEEALRESKERYRRLVENISDAVLVDDVAGHVVFANERFLHLFGLGREQLASLRLEDYIVPEYCNEMRERHNRRMQGEAVATHFEYQGLHADGTRMWLEADVVPITGETGELVGTQSAIRDITQRKQAENAIRESEGRFRLVANTAPVMIWMSGLDRLCNYFNQPWLDFTGRPLEAELGNGWVDGVHRDDLDACWTTYSQAFDQRQSFKMQYRLRRHDGEYRWVSDFGVPRFDPAGSFEGFIGSCMDITEAKLAEETLANLGRKLMEAHEQERTWIARELHDDVNQRIALLAIELERWGQSLPESTADLHDHIQHARQRLLDISKDIQALSHRLHSSKLEYLGIGAAVKSFCKEVSEQHKVQVKFRQSDIPHNVPTEIALCVFRVLQEALQNAVKHSGAKHIKVELQGAPDEIRFTVSDSGTGFEPRNALSGEGVGLISMRERLSLVNGQLSIDSAPGRGTTISARVPFHAEEQLRRSAAS